VTFLGGTYYQWTRLAPVEAGGWHWLQTVVLVNPLIYVNEGMRAAFTDAPHMHLYVVYPVLVGAGPLIQSIRTPRPGDGNLPVSREEDRDGDEGAGGEN
jgi:ABC-2 type transport system permease protein